MNRAGARCSAGALVRYVCTDDSEPPPLCVHENWVYKKESKYCEEKGREEDGTVKQESWRVGDSGWNGKKERKKKKACSLGRKTN